MTPDDVQDDVELRLRLLPGVVAVGFEPTNGGGASVVVTVANGSDPDAVQEDAASVVAALPASGLRIDPWRVRSVPPNEHAERLQRRIELIDGVQGCVIDTDPDEGIRTIRAQVGTIAAVAYVGDLVEEELGQAFARRSLHFEFQLPTTRGRGRAGTVG